MRMMWVIPIVMVLFSCSTDRGTREEPLVSIQLDFERIESGTYHPFIVTAKITENGKGKSGIIPTFSVPKGTCSAVKDLSNGLYTCTVTPDGTGIFPVTVSWKDTSLRREALVLKNVLSGSGQPLLVPGMVNTDGYEDGVNITADGQYLFVQYGPVYFSGIFLYASICAEKGWSGYDLVGGTDHPDAKWVFDTIGPYQAPLRPDFPVDGIQDGKLKHLKSIVIPGIVNGLVSFPTVFYGFQKQKDGAFAQPFKVAFDDERGINGPFGLSFHQTGGKRAEFAVAWNNYFHDLGDDKPDIYTGTLTLGQNTNLGNVQYGSKAGHEEIFTSIAPHISPLNFSSHIGVQGNPHLFAGQSGKVTSVWTDDEQVSRDITVYCLESGEFPAGVWTPIILPSVINTVTSESQPFFTGDRLYLNRDVRIVYHAYTGTLDALGYANTKNWGPEVEVLASGEVGVGTIFGVGEPSIGTTDGKDYLYFAYVESRAEGEVAGRYDFDLGAAFVEIR